MNHSENYLPGLAPLASSRTYTENITEYSSRRLNGVQSPATIEDLVSLIKEANQKQQSIYPIATGRNWGLGSAQPVEDDCTILHLAGLNEIREVNERFRYAIIEPGVTQGQLSAYLQRYHPDFVFPMTGSGVHTSILGNMMDRGICVRGHRYNYLKGMEVILANGDMVRTGFWHHHVENKSCRHIYAPGIGPDLNGLFTQSNLGVTSAIVIGLEKRRPFRLMSMVAPEAKLPIITDLLFELREDDLLRDGLLLTGMQDPRTSAGEHIPRGNWFACGAIQGPEAIQEATMLAIRHKLEAHCSSLDFYQADKIPANVQPGYLQVIADMYNGIPSNYALETMARLGGSELSTNHEIDEIKSVIGFVCALPVIPFEGEGLTEAVRSIDALSENLGVTPYYNFVGISRTGMEGFFRIFFDRNDPEAVTKAHLWNEQVHDCLESLNLCPYRINIEQMKKLYENTEDTFWQTISQIKQQLDPHNIIAPGRYCPNNSQFK